MSDTNNEQLKIFFVRKPESLEDLKTSFLQREPHEFEIGKVTETVTFSQEEYDDFTNDFFVNLDFLSGKGGSCKKGFYQTIKIIAPDRETLFVNPAGYDYARYVGMRVDLPPELDNRKLSIPIYRNEFFNRPLKSLVEDYTIHKIEFYEGFIHVTFDTMFDKQGFQAAFC